MKSEKVRKSNIICKLKKYLKSYWKEALLILGIIVCPFAIEIALFNTPVISEFDNSTWFSFMGSYIGAIITIVVMLITFRKSDKENKKMIEAQMEWAEFQNRNERIVEIIKVLFLEDYFFLNKDSVNENIDRFIRNLRKIQWDTYMLNAIEVEGKALMTELLKLQIEENKILNIDKLIHVDSAEKAKEFIEQNMQRGMNLRRVAEENRDKIQALYKDYYKKMYQKYYMRILDNT